MAHEFIAFPDVEAAIVSWLVLELPNHGITDPVSTRIPNPRPARFIRVQRTGGRRQDLLVDGAQVSIECWDNDAVDAATTARIVRAVVAAAHNERTPTGDILYRTQEFVGPFLLPDLSEQYRYTWTVQVQMRGVVLTPV